MSTFKKLLALTLALAMVLSVSAFAGYKADTYADADKIDPDCEDAVELLYALDIMKGDGKNFNPEASVTRAEMAKMIYVVLNYGDDDEATNYTGAKLFSDVPAGAWYEGYVNYCGVTKLVQGRPDGTFGPMDPVTCAEAAKMLLTAIGYTAEDRGYVGANWANNVLHDAALVGLLDNYGYNTNTYAPRQWVAVMMENALWADTYRTVRPVTFNGLLTSSAKLDDDVIKMGKKYFKLDTFEGIAVATEKATFDKTAAAAEYVRFVVGEDEVEVADTGLGSLDLGQTYKVIYKMGSDKDNEDYVGSAYSVRSLSDVAESHVHDMEVEVKYGISSNKAANKFEFTIGDMVAKFEDKEIPVLKTGTVYTKEAVKSGKLGVQELYDAVEDGKGDEPTNDVYKMIDTDANGTIDYVIVVEYDYAQVKKVGSHNKYGEYVQLAGAVVDAVEFDGDSKLYLEHAISGDDLEKSDFVKYTWDLDEGVYAVEVLEAIEGATYDARDNKKEIYTIDGEDYMLADNAFLKADFKDWLKDTKLGKSINYVADGDMLVSRWADADEYITELDAVNEMLALVVDVDATFSTGTLHEKEYIEYMTIDGETHIAEYKEAKGAVKFNALVDLGMDQYEKETDLAGRLFVYEVDDNGRVSLYEIDFVADEGKETGEITLNDSDVDSDLLNLYEVKGDFVTENNVHLDATGTSVKFDEDKMAADNTFFYAYEDDDGDAVFGVITPAEMGDGEDFTAYGQVMSYQKSSTNKRTTVMAGYVVFDLTTDEDNDYLVITEIGKETADGLELTVQFIGGEEETIYVDNSEENFQVYYTDLLYSYNYKTMDDEYTLTLIDKTKVTDKVLWLDEEDAEIKLNTAGVLDISDDDEVEHIVVVTIEYLRDETQTPDTENDDSLYVNEDLYEEYDRTLEIVAYEDLVADDIEDGTTDSYEQKNYCYYENELLYIVVLHDMNQAQ